MAQEKSIISKSPVLPSSPRLTRDILPSEGIALSKNGQERLNDKLFNEVAIGDKASILHLINAGADISATQNDNGWTPLHIAAWNQKTKICLLLIEQCAKADGNINEFLAIKDIRNNMTVLDWAKMHKPSTKTALFFKSIKFLAETAESAHLNSFILSFTECISF